MATESNAEVGSTLRIMATQVPYIELGGFDLKEFAENLIKAATRLEAAEAKIEQQQEAWPPLRAVLEKYIYDVGGKPNVVKAAVLEYEQAVAKAEEEQTNDDR